MYLKDKAKPLLSASSHLTFGVG